MVEERIEGDAAMAESITGPVGLRWRSQNVTNAAADQAAIIRLLAAIPEAQGGQKQAWAFPPLTGPDGSCPPALANAIWDFQSFWKAQGVFHFIDGVVDPGQNTLRQMNSLAGGAAPPAPPPGPPAVFIVHDVRLFGWKPGGDVLEVNGDTPLQWLIDNAVTRGKAAGGNLTLKIMAHGLPGFV